MRLAITDLACYSVHTLVGRGTRLVTAIKSAAWGFGWIPGYVYLW
ncbi:hypothetical protein [Catenulispora pinisilvae]|nr:hypothetical protein [Catenulispora pinisilvae]